MFSFKTIFRHFRFKVVLFLYLIFCSFNYANASYVVYCLDPLTNQDNCLEGWSNTWVEPSTSSTMFSPTIDVYYDFMLACCGYKGSVTLESSGNNCAYIGIYRYCARLADPNENSNSFACNSDDTSCVESSTTSCGTGTCTTGYNYSCQGYDNQDDTEYVCNTGGYYSCYCPDCENICSTRICAYQDPASSDNINEECDDINACMDAANGETVYFPSNAWMPYFENTVVAYETIWGTNVYFNNVGGDFVGCVDIPLGPYPPPYCDPISGSTPVVSNTNVCEYSPQYELSETTNDAGEAGNYEQVSTSNSVCELSTDNGIPGTPYYSIFETPLVRLYFNNALNICPSGYQLPDPPPSPGDDTCVYLDTSYSVEELWQNQQNLLPVCTSEQISEGSTATVNCVYFPTGYTSGPIGCTTDPGTNTLNCDYTYYRVYFNEPSSSSPSTIWSYGSDIASELALYGIYNAQYTDITDQSCTDCSSSSSSSTSSGSSTSCPGPGSFSYTNSYGTTRYYGTVEMDDYEGNQRCFGAFIDLGMDPYTGEATNGAGNGTQICVDEVSSTSGNTPVTCVDRPWMFPPAVSSCLNYGDCYYDSTDTPNISAQPRIQVTVGGTTINGGTAAPTVTGVIGVDIPSGEAPLSFCVVDDNNPSSSPQQNPSSSDLSSDSSETCTIYQAELFSAYITDNINYSIYNDDNVQSDGSIPNQTGTKQPYTSCSPSCQYEYTGGMQYKDYVYCRGATQICLNGYSNSLKTVVAKMVKIVSGDSTTYTPSTILTDRIIPPYPAPGGEVYPLENSLLYNSAVNNYYSPATSTATYIGYLTNGTCLQGSGCNDSSSGTSCCASTDGQTCTSSDSIVYPSAVLCTCTSSTCNSSTDPSEAPAGCTCGSSGCSYACSSSILEQCNVAYQSTTSYTISGSTTTVTTTSYCNVDSPSTAYTTTTPMDSSSTDNPTTLSGYQYPGNQMGDTFTDSDDMPNPWTSGGCYYDSGTNQTICPVTNSDGEPAFGVRALTPMELGLCVPLLAPYCDSINSTEGDTESNGYATWPQTGAGSTATGTCVDSEQSPSGPPTRQCLFQDTVGSNGQVETNSTNGCPEYTQVWGAVTNPCVIAPPWWPGVFLAGNADYQGAIINQFNVALNYRSSYNSSKYLTPLSANADPLNLYTTANNTQYNSFTTSSTNSKPILPEPWNSCYASCSRDGAGTTSNYARTTTNGDQEMLYLTQSQWTSFWNSTTMGWLLASSDTSSNDGCYVYSLCTSFDSSGNCTAANINANFKGITPAMKICKYQDNISFALVDLGTYINGVYEYPTDYTNTQYLMQSNMLAYYAYIKNTGNVSVNSWCHSSDTDTTQSIYLTNNITNQNSPYDTRINNGIVVSRSGFGFTSSDSNNNGQLPTGFEQCNAAKCGSCSSGSCVYQESVTMQYNFDQYYEGSYSCNCSCVDSCCETCHTTCNNYNPTTTAGGTGTYSTSSSKMDTQANNTTNFYSTINPLAVFNKNVTLSSAQTALNYLMSSTFDTSYNHYYTPNFTSIWVPKACSESLEEQYCTMVINLGNYVSGNSAANPAMFYWANSSSYNVTNPGTVGYGSYGQVNQ